MYNKLFTKILDSSIWLAPDPHRLVWITFLAAMDEDGNVMFASPANVAARARVSEKAAEKAIEAFENPDHRSGDPDNDGRRIERIIGGWHVLNAHKYRAMVTKQIIRDQTKERTKKWRESKKLEARDASVTHRNESVTPSEAVSVAKADAESRPRDVPPSGTATNQNFEFVGKVPATKPAVTPNAIRVFEHWKTVHRHPNARLDNKRLRLIEVRLSEYSESDLCQAISGYCNSPHHMGQNDKATIYDDLALLLRDAAHVDAGLRFFAEPPRADLSEKTRKIVSQTQDWQPPEMRNANK